jgi:hypothetical protein
MASRSESSAGAALLLAYAVQVKAKLSRFIEVIHGRNL